MEQRVWDAGEREVESEKVRECNAMAGKESWSLLG